MEHPLLFIDRLLAAMGLEHFAHEFSHVTHSWLVMLVLIISALVFTRSIRLLPQKGQNFFEVVVEGLENFMVEISGPEGRFFFPYIATIFIFILVCNLLGLIPGLFSPTANINTTLSMAICTFIYTHVIGVKFHGKRYLKHFLGSVWWLTPLLLPIELIGHFARILSLSVRLFGNIFGKELVLSILVGIAGLYLVPLPIYFLGILVAFIQALIFMLLSVMYFVGAMEEAH